MFSLSGEFLEKLNQEQRAEVKLSWNAARFNECMSSSCVPMECGVAFYFSFVTHKTTICRGVFIYIFHEAGDEELRVEIRMRKAGKTRFKAQ